MNDLAELIERLAKAQAEFEEITKQHTAQAGSRGTYSYADLRDVLKATRPYLNKHGIAFLQRTRVDENGHHLVTELRFGDAVLDSVMDLAYDGLNPQQIGSLRSYMRRYEAQGITGVHPAGEDDDGAGAAEVTARPPVPRDRSRTIPVTAASQKQMDLIDRLMRDLKIEALRDPFTQLVLDELPNPLSTAQASKLIDALQDAKKGVWPQGWINAPAGNRVDDETEPW